MISTGVTFLSSGRMYFSPSFFVLGKAAAILSAIKEAL